MKNTEKILVEQWLPGNSIVYILKTVNGKKQWSPFLEIPKGEQGVLPKGPKETPELILEGFKKSLEELPDPDAKRDVKKEKLTSSQTYAWCVCKDLDNYIRKDGKTVKVPFHINNAEAFGTFIIDRPSYINNMDLVCQHLNYFIEFYDKDKELILAYLKIKSLIDNKEQAYIPPENFRSMLFSILFSPSILNKIDAFVEDNYLLHIDEDSKTKKYSEQTKFTDRHTKIIYKASTAIKIIIVPVMHYLHASGLAQNAYLHKFFMKVFDVVSDPDVNILNKFYVWIEKDVKLEVSRSAPLWKKLSAYGSNPVIWMTQLLQKHLVVDSFYKYRFDSNPVTMNYVIIRNQIGFMSSTKFEHNVIDITPEAGANNSNELTKLDKILMQAAKVDESSIVISEASINRTIKKIVYEMGNPIKDEEVEFYMKYHKLNTKLQMVLVQYYFAQYFNGFLDLKLVQKRQYMILMLCLKKKLQALGFEYLPYIISSNIEGKTNARIIQNNAFKEKLTNSYMYEILERDKFSIIKKMYDDENTKNKNPKLQLMSMIVNSRFSYVDYQMGTNQLGELIELNQDDVCDEFIRFMNMI